MLHFSELESRVNQLKVRMSLYKLIKIHFVTIQLIRIPYTQAFIYIERINMCRRVHVLFLCYLI